MIHFKIGITFSGQYRARYIEPICKQLLTLGYRKDDIFYDEWHGVLFNGANGDKKLRQIYYECCDCVVVLLSPDYKERNWTGNIEWKSIKELINTGKEDQICLLSIDSADIGEIDGLYQNQAIAKSIDNLSIREIAEFIDQKYRLMIDGGNTYTCFPKKKVNRYIKPGLIRANYSGVDIKPEWTVYLDDLLTKMSKYIDYYGKLNSHYEDGEEWHVTRCSKNGILLFFREDIESDQNPARVQWCVFDDYNPAFPDDGNLVFNLVFYKNNTAKLEFYIPGDWDDRIFSWP